MRTVKTRSREAGQVLILVLLSLVVLLGFAALATDVGAMFHAKRLVQTAADSAAIAGALELPNPGDPGSCTGNAGTATTGAVCAAAMADAARNGVANGVKGTTVAVNKPPQYGPHAGNSNYVEVIATQPQQTFFMGLFGRNSMNVQARAVAYLGAGTSEGCVYALDPTSSKDVYVNDTAGYLQTKCAIYSDSKASDSAATKAGGIICGKVVGIVGGVGGSGHVFQGTCPGATGSPITGMVPVADPLAYMTPPTVPSGPCNPQSSGSFVPGYYCGITGAATLSPGLYILSGDLALSGSNVVSGSGVTIYLVNAGVSLNGSSSLSLTAASCTVTAGTNPPLCSSGAYNGIVLWSTTTGNVHCGSEGNVGFCAVGTHPNNIEGVFYFPNAPIAFQGNGSTALNAAIVALRVTFFGSVTLNGYPLTSGTYPVTAATLAE
jgi:Putative Flp pilus-assembly TadE/G-like